MVQAMAGVLAYNLAENDEKIIFDYNSNAYQNSHCIENIDKIDKIDIFSLKEEEE